MKLSFKFLLSIIVFIVPSLLLNTFLPSLGNDHIINLILRIGVNSLTFLTIFYLFHQEIFNNYQLTKNNKKLINIILYILLLLFGFIISKLITFIILKSSNETIFKFNYLFKRIPVYMFINYIIIFPLMETLIFRYSLHRLIKNSLLFILTSLLLFSGYVIYIQDSFELYLLFSGFILALAYLKTENIILTTIINTIFNLIIFCLNFL